MKKSPLLPTALATLLFAAAAHGQSTLVGFDFSRDATHTGAETSSTAVTVAPTLTVGMLTRGSGFAAVDGTDPYTQNSFGVNPNGNNYQASVANATALGEYITFTLTPAAGRVSLGSLAFGIGTQNGGAVGGLSYSVNGGVSFTEVAGTKTTANAGFYYTPDTYSFNLSGQATLQNDTQTVTFRLFALENPANGAFNLGSFRVGDSAAADQTPLDVIVSGTVSGVPEPSGVALVALGVAGGLILRRARARAGA